VQPYVNPSSKAMNGLGGIFTAIGKPGTLTPTFDPATGDLNFSFSTLEAGNLVLGVCTFDGIMQVAIVAVEGAPRMLWSSRVVLNPDGSEGRVDAASEPQLRELTDRFNTTHGILETLIIEVDERATLTYEFLTGDRQRASGVLERGTAPPAPQPDP
jgi:hypothetical protein